MVPYLENPLVALICSWHVSDIHQRHPFPHLYFAPGMANQGYYQGGPQYPQQRFVRPVRRDLGDEQLTFVTAMAAAIHHSSKVIHRSKVMHHSKAMAVVTTKVLLYVPS